MAREKATKLSETCGVDLNQKLQNFSGDTLGDGGAPLTLCSVVLLSLQGNMRKQTAPELTPQDSSKCFETGVRLAGFRGKASKVLLNREEAKFIAEQIQASTWTSLVSEQSKLMLQGEPTGLEQNSE